MGELREKIADMIRTRHKPRNVWSTPPDILAQDILSLISAEHQEQLNSLRQQIEAVSKKLDDREADLIEAKREERKCISKELDKLEVIGDEEITKIECSCTYPDYSSGNNGFYVNWEKFAAELAQAQLDDTRRQIREMLG